MKLIEQSVELLNVQHYEDVVRLVEGSGRLCYKSKPSKDLKGAEKFIQNLIRAGHESVVEHLSISAKITTSRNITHQIVRHRLHSYSQLSSRYVNQSDEFGIKVIRPNITLGSKEYELFRDAIESSEHAYLSLKAMGVKNDIAREVLPGCVATAIVMTGNVRSWRHFFKLRCHSSSHYQIQEVALMALKQMYEVYPCFFEDLYLEFVEDK